MNEEERWTMHGLDYDDPACIRTVEELEGYIEELGFLPFFRCEIPGFSVEEHTASDTWWTGDPARDPWEWRKILAARGNVAYGKFFNRNAGFISKAWFPAFANYRRDGYDFDARWDDELASMKSKKIMDLFAEENADRELFSFETKQLAGYGKTGEKNFDGEMTNLQMQTYLCIRDFKRRKNKSGNEYGWGIVVYCTPEHIWGYDHVTSLYREDPKDSALQIFERVRQLYPEVEDGYLRKVLGIKNVGAPEEKKVVPYEDHSDYLRSWISVLQNDYNEFFRACADAEQIAKRLIENYTRKYELKLTIDELPEKKTETGIEQEVERCL